MGIILMTTDGFPIPVDQQELKTLRTFGGLGFLFGMIAIMVMIALSGWTKSKALGWFSSIVGLITFLMIVYLMT